MYIRVEVVAASRSEKIEKKPGQACLKIWVREKPEQNQANKRVLQIVREQYPEATRIQMVAGHHHQKKIIAIEQTL